MLTDLKVQVQIGGASQISTTYAATLHYQMAYRLQNHAFDMSLPSSTDEALFLTINAPHQASCVHVPRQISRPELLKLLPESWVTAYEKNQQKPIPVQSSNPLFISKPDGTVEISFPKETSASSSTHPVIFPSRIDMIVDGSRPEPPIKYFQSSGLPVFYFKNPETGHCYFDTCNCDECLEDSLLDDDEDFEEPASQSSPLPSTPCKSPSSPQPPSKNDPSAQPSGCFMFTESDFPPLEYHNPQERTTHRHKVPDSTTILPDGSTKAVSAAEAAINWQSANSLAQNKILQRIANSQQNLENAVHKKLSTLDLLIRYLQQKIQNVHQELLQMAYANQAFSAAFYHKDAEMKHLKNQLQSLQAQQYSQQKSPFDMFASSTPQSFFGYPQMSQPLPITPTSGFGESSSNIFGSPSAFLPPPKRPSPPKLPFPKPQIKPIQVPSAPSPPSTSTSAPTTSAPSKPSDLNSKSPQLMV
ncbi:hypothetical protein RHMOL_Rhmol11G0057200 [Rhododendron molle]|uniref:Uncharacterized protein n=1 Tax=Rhododendron molle TaxID=49168 RepID=A0ACC0LNX7_RHOML|nr:hypothetical protein RHMOL_Rhmol11G0057200 [Rhododendron molle]